jgi:hypothetical protein
MLTATHAFGTTRRATVAGANPSSVPARLLQLVKDDQGEYHFLACGAQDETAEVGASGTLTFTEGGPTGGYWKFVKDKLERL